MNLIVKHKLKDGEYVNHWFLRGISDSGKFYGEIRKETDTSRNAFKWSGELTSDESASIQEIACRLSEDFEPVDLTDAGAWQTNIFSGKMGGGNYRQLAVIDVEEKQFPTGCKVLVDELVSIFVRYATEKYLVPIGVD